MPPVYRTPSRIGDEALERPGRAEVRRSGQRPDQAAETGKRPPDGRTGIRDATPRPRPIPVSMPARVSSVLPGGTDSMAAVSP